MMTTNDSAIAGEMPQDNALQRAEADATALARIRAAVDSVLAQPISTTTADQYLRARRRMRATGLKPEELGARSRRSYQLYRAALIRGVAVHLRSLFDALRALTPQKRDRRMALVGEIKTHAAVLDRYPPHGDGPSVWRKPATGLRKTGKRRGLAKLPNDWRDRIFSHSPKYRDAVAVLWLAGVRPEELVRGVEIELVAEALLIRIPGAKVSSDRGQPLREIVVDSHSVPAVWLCDRLDAEDRRLVVRIDNARRLSDALRSASRRIWPTREYVVSPYSFRHQFASELKSSGRSREEIAAAMGHLTTRSQGSYGRARQSRGAAITLVRVRSSRPVLADAADRTFAARSNGRFALRGVSSSS